MVDSAYCISLHGSLIVIYSAIFLFGSQFHKHIADGWNCSIPYCCSVNVIACERPDTASYLNYLVRLKGIAGEERRISICETLQSKGKVLRNRPCPSLNVHYFLAVFLNLRPASTR